MNLEELKTRFPKVYAAAVAEGVDQERERVTAHVELGEKTGDLRTALAAIRNGATMTPEIFGHYLSGRNRADIAARFEDDDVVQAVLANIAQPTSTHVDSFERQVADRFVALVGRDDGGANIEDLEDV